MIVPQRLKEARLELKLTQKQAAQAANLSQEQISQYESGKIKRVSHEYITFLISQGISLDFLHGKSANLRGGAEPAPDAEPDKSSSGSTTVKQKKTTWLSKQIKSLVKENKALQEDKQSLQEDRRQLQNQISELIGIVKQQHGVLEQARKTSSETNTLLREIYQLLKKS